MSYLSFCLIGNCVPPTFSSVFMAQQFFFVFRLSLCLYNPSVTHYSVPRLSFCPTWLSVLSVSSAASVIVSHLPFHQFLYLSNYFGLMFLLSFCPTWLFVSSVCLSQLSFCLNCHSVTEAFVSDESFCVICLFDIVYCLSFFAVSSKSCLNCLLNILLQL